MNTPALTLPQPVALQRWRPCQRNIPQLKAERDRIQRVVQEYVGQHNPTPPFAAEELRGHSDAVVNLAGVDPVFGDYIAVLVSNEAWREQLATIPYEKRLLLLPKCLRVEEKCPAPFDEFGLLCKKCGLCTIQDLQTEAERLGYAVLVAEGSAIVMALIQTGKVEGIVGVSCLSVLERTFPYMEAAAIPGIAIPLLQDDCRDTNVDLDWVWDVIHLTSEDKTRRLDLDALRSEVETWFAPDALDATLGPANSETEQIARGWLAKSGKRWRPFLTVCTYQAFQDDPQMALPSDLRKVAVAVECFHKASLIHDDIEDADSERYGEKTLHEEFGVPVALNVGDFLLGEGYRLIAECEAPSAAKAEMLRVAAAGHRSLSLGQGAELCWMRNPKALKSVEVLDIFRQKTAPAFEVALLLGSIYAGGGNDVSAVLHEYSEALGIAYQIRDDLDDFFEESQDFHAMRPSVLFSVAHERAQGDDKAFIASLWKREIDFESNKDRARALVTKAKAEERAQKLFESYKEEAIRSLRLLDNSNLKGLLRRVIGKIFNDLEIKGWCKEFEAKNLPKEAETNAAQAAPAEAA